MCIQMILSIGKWVVVKYDRHVYPGILQDADEDSVRVEVMHRIGPNRVFWPLRKDSIWYEYEDVVTVIPEPKLVTKRHHQVEPKLWGKICELNDFQ